MAHFAELDENNIVKRVLAVDNEVIIKDGEESEEIGITFLQGLFGEISVWKQTSYNTLAGEHMLGGTPLRKNYAGTGYKYDQAKDAFIAPQPYPSWLLDDDTCKWNAPTPYPDDDKIYYWDEETTSWEEIE